MTRSKPVVDGVSVVIPTWNGRALLERFLPSVVDSTTAFTKTTACPTETLVVDDASTDDTADWIARTYPAIRTVCQSTRHGFAGTANAGVRAARYGRVYLLNNDVALTHDTLDPLIDHCRDPHVFAVASQVYDYETGMLRGAGQGGSFRRGFLRIHRRHFVARPAEGTTGPYLTSFASGGSSLYDRKTFLELGGFDERFAPFGWEDVEISLRAWLQGYEVRFEPRSAVWHRFSSTIGERFLPRQVRTVNERNRLWTHWLHVDTPLHWMEHALFLTLRLLGSTVTGRWETWNAFGQAARKWPEVRAQRREWDATRTRTLGDLATLLRAERRRPEVSALRDDVAPVRPCPAPGVADSP